MKNCIKKVDLYDVHLQGHIALSWQMYKLYKFWSNQEVIIAETVHCLHECCAKDLGRLELNEWIHKWCSETGNSRAV